MSSSTSINLAALGFGGIDTSTLLSSLVSIDEQPIAQLQSQQSNIESASSTITSFASDLSTLSNAATALSDPSTFGAMQASSSSSSVVATATGSPQAGTWSVSVQQVAQNQRTISNGDSSSTAALGLSGTLNISVGSGSPVGVSLTSGESLSDVANSIAEADPGVQASIIYDGSQYHLLVSGSNTGASNAVTFDESGLSSSSGYALGLSTASNTIQSAQDAELTVGGVAVSSASNLVTSAIPGVSLAVTQPTTSPSTVTISSDSSSLVTQVQSFVTAYNAMVNDAHTDAGYGSTNAQNTLLQGDLGITSSTDQLSQILASEIPGGGGQYTTLASVGISMNDDGTLTFDQTDFTAALQSDPTDVQNLFVTQSDGTQGAMGMLTSAISSLTDPADGILTSEVNSYSSQNSSLSADISNMEEQVTAYQAQLESQFTQMNTQLAEYKQMSNALTQESDEESSSSSSSSVV